MARIIQIDGKPVKDAKNELTVLITRQDVKAGASKKAKCCAAAQALIRQHGCTEARVHTSRVYIKKNGKWLRYYTPPALRQEIVSFDRGGSFEPGEYKLTPVYMSERAGAREARRTAPRAPHKPADVRIARKQHVTAGVRERFVG